MVLLQGCKCVYQLCQWVCQQLLSDVQKAVDAVDAMQYFFKLCNFCFVFAGIFDTFYNIFLLRSQKSEFRSQKSEVRSQKSEVRSQKLEVRSQSEKQLTIVPKTQSSRRKATKFESTQIEHFNAVPDLGRVRLRVRVRVMVKERVRFVLTLKHNLDLRVISLSPRG